MVLIILIARGKKRAVLKRLGKLKRNELELSPEEFFELRTSKMLPGTKRGAKDELNFAGVYILYNTSRNLYYVGQGQNVVQRVNNHLTGKGNGDVYADYKYGDIFVIRMVEYALSGTKSLNELERLVIAAYDAYATGYNKTRGNR